MARAQGRTRALKMMAMLSGLTGIQRDSLQWGWESVIFTEKRNCWSRMAESWRLSERAVLRKWKTKMLQRCDAFAGRDGGATVAHRLNLAGSSNVREGRSARALGGERGKETGTTWTKCWTSQKPDRAKKAVKAVWCIEMASVML